MKRKKSMGIHTPCALTFLGVCGSVMLAIHSLSAEDGQMPNARNEIVTEKIREQVSTRLGTTGEGIVLSERIKYFVIPHSPYGSDWNANIGKLAHFSIYFTLAAGIYITLAILGVNKFWRLLLTIGICFCFTFGDGHHQKFAGRISSMSDVYLDTSGILASTCIWTVTFIIYSGIHLLVNKAYGDA